MKKLNLTPEQAEKRMWISGILFLLAIVLVYTGFQILTSQPMEDRALAPFRKIFAFNEKVANTIGNPTRLSKEFPKSEAVKPSRANGFIGLSLEIDADEYRFEVVNPKDTSLNLSLGLADLKKLPYKDLVFDFKCIEGWSQVQHWGGAPFKDLVKKYNLASKTGEPVITGLEPYAYKYVGMISADGDYFVGIDLKSAMHPQTILAWSNNDQPLSQKNGFPLRLIIPVKYGVKHIKQIGTIFFSDSPPRDYWAERGYDYDSGL